ncbi:hypothetical protein BP5796_08994 [Coleophoma crateriformis]|uniref:Cytochrome b561 domain-containing protein n=1 Tax=Coleophoma crateriformis TaxID=565419 RepID=A0A3D8R2T5_9HELO|nr:hypothetical protein BP5796_08994 [Coleophoma crateriformis]
MASATGIPENVQAAAQRGLGEEEPLLGRVGAASQEDGQPIYYNFIIGTAILAQAGILLLTALVWANVFLSPLMLFTAHPILNSSGLFLIAEGIIILQPTHTAEQKRHGTIAHATLNGLAAAALISGLVVIEVNKFAHNGIHFESPHAILGLTTYILLLIQSVVGFTQYFTPKLFGSVDKAKSIYKWHRLSGYIVLVLMLATVAAATQTTFNKNALHIRLWAVLISSVLVLLGIVPRIKKQKFGFGTKAQSSGAFGQ